MESEKSKERSFLFGDPQVATEADLRASWYGKRNRENFRCHLCGHRFALGDYWRCVYTNDMSDGVPGGNPLVCRTCDEGNSAVRAEWKRMHELVNQPKYWAVYRSVRESHGD
jgi:hypothetical protein